MADEEDKHVSRQEAIERGLKFYKGNPCRRGHNGVRWLYNGMCVLCNADHLRSQISKDRDREYRKKPENRKRRSSVRKAHWKKNNERLNAQQRARVAARSSEDKQKRTEYNKRYYRNNKERSRAGGHRYLARKRGSGGSHTAQDIADIRRMQKDRCAMPTCRKILRGKGHVDHIVPLAKGGSNHRRNIQLLCAHCNCSKRATDQIEYVRRLGMLL